MKNIIVTGAGDGIGFFFVMQLLKEGYNVTALDLNIDRLAGAQDEFTGLLPFVCDIRDAQRLESCVRESAERFGSADCAVHNACFCTFESMENTGIDIYREVFEVNYFGALNLVRAVIPLMKERGGGKIIFTSSGVGVTGFDSISPYASSKGALETLAKCLNIEYINRGISFHIFHPPLTRTKSSEPLPVPKEFMADPQKVGVGLAKKLACKRFIICHSFGQRLQTRLCYLFPVKTGRLLSKMTRAYKEKNREGKN